MSKHICIFYFTFLFVLTAEAQLQIGYHYIIKKGFPIYYTYIDTTRDPDKKILALDMHIFVPGVTKSFIDIDRSGTYPITIHYYPGLIQCANKLKASVVQKEGDLSGKLYIDFWGISKESEKCKDIKYINQAVKLGQFYFQLKQKIKLGDPTSYRSIRFTTTEVGIVTIPFKYRFGYNRDTTMVPNEASTSANIAVYIGRKWGSTRFYVDKAKSKSGSVFTASTFLGPTVITVSKENAFPSKDSIQKKQLSTKANELGICIGIGATYSIMNFNIGLFTGIDFPITGNTRKWYYAKKPWIGFGIGYKLILLGEK